MILSTIMLGLLMVLVALAVDVGYINLARTQLQVAADSAALAGADTLYDNLSSAPYQAEYFAEANLVGSVPVQIERSQDVQFGIWNRRTRTFSPQVALDAATDAVRVTTRRTQTRGNPLSLFFARVIGANSTDVSAYAIAQAQNGFCGGFIGLDWAHVHGNSYTDSYFSEDGLYGSQTPGGNGHVCSNGTVTLEGGITVNGNVSTVEGQTIDMSTGSPTVNGRLNYRPEDVYAPPIDVGNAATVNDNAFIPLNKFGDLKLTGGTVVMPPGTYYLNDLSISSSGIVTVSGPTVVFVEGTLNIAGQGIANITQVPSNLQIYTLGSKATVAGGADFYGTIYGPTTAVKISGNADYFGVALGKTMEITPTSTSAGTHHDESVGRLLHVKPRPFLVE